MTPAAYRRVLAIAAGPGAPSGAPSAQLVPAQSEIAFTSKQMGVPVDGQFSKFDAQLAFDPSKPEAGKVALDDRLRPASSLGVAESDAELAKPAWFDVAQLSAGHASSRAPIKAAGRRQLEVAGKLGDQGPDARRRRAGDADAGRRPVDHATGSFAIQRLDFKIGEGEWTDTSMVADDVQVHVQAG